MSTITFKLVSPIKDLYSADVEMVIVPSENGDMGIMAGHSPVIAHLRAGTIVIPNSSGEDIRLFVDGGFLEVTGQKAIVLAEHAMPLSEIDGNAVRETLRDLEKSIVTIDNDNERLRTQTTINIARAKLEAIETPAYS